LSDLQLAAKIGLTFPTPGGVHLYHELTATCVVMIWGLPANMRSGLKRKLLATLKVGLFPLRETYQNGFVRITLASLGGLGTMVGVAGLISARLVSEIPKYVWLLLFLAVIIFSFALCVPRKRARFTFDRGQWSIELTVGDLFDQETGIVVTVDRRVSLDVDQTGPDSLVGQLTSRWFGNDHRRLVSEVPITIPGAQDPDVALGTVARFSNPAGRQGWLFCLSTKTVDGSRTTWQDLASAYDALWLAMRRENSSSIAVPIIGAGFARSQLPFNGLMLFLILTFHAASLERPVTKSLRIVISEDDFDPRAFSAAGKFLAYLGYRKAS
jgi:hypothetical protein